MSAESDIRRLTEKVDYINQKLEKLELLIQERLCQDQRSEVTSPPVPGRHPQPNAPRKQKEEIDLYAVRSTERAVGGQLTLLGAPAQELTPDTSRLPSVSDMVGEVLAAYGKALEGPPRAPGTARLTPTRHRLVASRIRTHGLAAVVAAVGGWRHSPWHCGANPQGRWWCGLETVLAVSRHRDNVEAFAALAAAPPQPPLDPHGAGIVSRDAATSAARAAARDGNL